MFHTNYVAMNSQHGHNDTIIHTPPRNFYLLLYTKSESVFRIGETSYPVKPNTLILISPNSSISYSNPGDFYSDHWINFSDPEDILCSTHLEQDRLFLLENNLPVDEYFQLMVSAFHSELPGKQYTISLLLRSLLYTVENYISSDAIDCPHYSDLLALRRKIYESPMQGYTINELAKSINLSNVYLQELYKKAFHISCGNDIIQSRIIHAKNLLTETSLSIGEIAEQCGYKSAIHFSRQFKQHTGLSPQIWKKKI